MVSESGTLSENVPSVPVVAVRVVVARADAVIVTVTPARAGETLPDTVTLPPPVFFAGALRSTAVVGAGPPVGGGGTAAHEPTTKSAPGATSSGEVPPGARSTQCGWPPSSPSKVSTNGRASTVPAACAGRSSVTVPPAPSVTAPVVAPAVTKPPARVQVPWSYAGAAAGNVVTRT